MKRLPYLTACCYALLAAAWIVDLVTPQTFVAAILLNAPIALAGLALSTRLTTIMVVLAEVANVVAGYVNGVQAGYHWDTIAIGDRVLLGASFLLVGFLTLRAQEYSREAGSSSERIQMAEDEKALRRALSVVRATLNVDLVLRAIVREAQQLSGADEAVLIVRLTALDVPQIYRFKAGADGASVERHALDTATVSVVQRIVDMRQPYFADTSDTVAGLVLAQYGHPAMAAVRIAAQDSPAALLLFGKPLRSGFDRMLQLFADGCAVAISQAHLFMQLGYRNEEIASQRNALEERSRVIRDIVYALAHDLRTPLQAEHVTMQQALEGAYGDLPVQYREVLETTLQTNADVRQLVETLLLVARFESGETSTLREEFDVLEQAERVTRELQSLASLKDITVRCNGDTGICALGDPSELRRAMSNLLSNAIAATPSSGSVEVSVRSEGADAVFDVRDDGFGVPAELREHLFQRFGTGARAPGSGTGLGLYIVRLIAEKFGGSVAYRSHEPRGSEFVLRIPAVRTKTAA